MIYSDQRPDSNRRSLF